MLYLQGMRRLCSNFPASIVDIRGGSGFPVIRSRRIATCKAPEHKTEATCLETVSFRCSTLVVFTVFSSAGLDRQAPSWVRVEEFNLS